MNDRQTPSNGALTSPAAQRNREPIRQVWLQHMPTKGTVLEIASGTGEHGAHIAPSLPGLVWWYSDIEPDYMASQHAWTARLGPDSGLKGPVRIDVTEPGWSAPAPPDALYCANMIHIAPFAAARGLFAGAGRLLQAGGRLMLYGPFARDGEIAPSNAAFSADLKRRHPDWGVRDLAIDILPLAEAAGLTLDTIVEMPANNLSVIFVRP